MLWLLAPSSAGIGRSKPTPIAIIALKVQIALITIFVFEPGGSTPGDSLCGQYTPGRARRMIQLRCMLGR